MVGVPLSILWVLPGYLISSWQPRIWTDNDCGESAQPRPFGTVLGFLDDIERDAPNESNPRTVPGHSFLCNGILPEIVVDRSTTHLGVRRPFLRTENNQAS